MTNVDDESGDNRVLPWLPSILGIVAVIAFVVATIVRLMPGDEDTASLPPPEPAFTLPGVTSGPQIPISLLPGTPGASGGADAGASGAAGSGGIEEAAETTPAGEATGDPEPTGTRTTTPPRTVAPTAAPGVSGTYRVLNSYSDSFIAEILLSNDTGTELNWTATISYPGSLVTSWLESLPQPTLVRSGTRYTWTSSVPLAAHSTGSLRFHFKLSGSAGPSGCAVNGSACS